MDPLDELTGLANSFMTEYHLGPVEVLALLGDDLPHVREKLVHRLSSIPTEELRASIRAWQLLRAMQLAPPDTPVADLVVEQPIHIMSQTQAAQTMASIVIVRMAELYLTPDAGLDDARRDEMALDIVLSLHQAEVPAAMARQVPAHEWRADLIALARSQDPALAEQIAASFAAYDARQQP